MRVWRAHSWSLPPPPPHRSPTHFHPQQRCITFRGAKAQGNMSRDLWVCVCVYVRARERKNMYPGICIVNFGSDFQDGEIFLQFLFFDFQQLSIFLVCYFRSLGKWFCFGLAQNDEGVLKLLPETIWGVYIPPSKDLEDEKWQPKGKKFKKLKRLNLIKKFRIGTENICSEVLSINSVFDKWKLR